MLAPIFVQDYPFFQNDPDKSPALIRKPSLRLPGTDAILNEKHAKAEGLNPVSA